MSVFGLDHAGKEAGVDAVHEAAPVVEKAIETVSANAADAVSVVAGAVQQVQITVARESPLWRESLDRLTAQATRLVDWITGYEVDIHITNRKESK